MMAILSRSEGEEKEEDSLNVPTFHYLMIITANFNGTFMIRATVTFIPNNQSTALGDV